MQAEQTMENLQVWHYNGSTWDQQTKGDTSGSCETGAIDCYVEATGITSYSPFALDNVSPLAVQLAYFTAVPRGSGILLLWETVREVDNLGFHLYRSGTEVGPWDRLNTELIPSQAPGSAIGALYQWLDQSPTSGVIYVYRLVAVDAHGTAKTVGVATARASVPSNQVWLPVALR